MQTELPFYECPEEALKAAVAALGGAKIVGAKVFPDKTPDRAAQVLLDCLNPGRSEKLELGQVMMILRMARDAGVHTGMEYIAQRLSYAPPEPIEPADELAELLRENLQDLREAAKRQARIEALLANHQNPTRLRSA